MALNTTLPRDGDSIYPVSPFGLLAKIAIRLLDKVTTTTTAIIIFLTGVDLFSTLVILTVQPNGGGWSEFGPWGSQAAGIFGPVIGPSLLGLFITAGCIFGEIVTGEIGQKRLSRFQIQRLSSAVNSLRVSARISFLLFLDPTGISSYSVILPQLKLAIEVITGLSVPTTFF